MKQAILITAYKDFDQLIELITMFDEDFNVYIHIDKKSKLDKNTLDEIYSFDNVKFVSREYEIKWGGLNHLKSILLLSNKALAEKNNVYFHLITGQDFPIKSSINFNRFFSKSLENKISYLDFFEMPASFWPYGGMNRLEYYNLYDLFNGKQNIGKTLIMVTLFIQKLFHIKRSLDFPFQLYGGSTYWSLHRDALQYVSEFTIQNPFFLKRLNYTFSAEEIYFQTVLMNSSYSETIINNNLRFIDWESERGGLPAFLDESDYNRLIHSSDFFARKIDYKRNGLHRMLKSYLRKNIYLDLCGETNTVQSHLGFRPSKPSLTMRILDFFFRNKS